MIDFTRMIAGTSGTAILADLGADVIKIEAPRIGDPTRANIPRIAAGSPTFLTCNRGKKSVVLDLKQAEAQSIVRDLVRSSDVLIENFRPGVMDEIGLGYERLNAINPDLIFCSLSGFGVNGPMRNRKSFDLVNQAFAGLISITGFPDSEPSRLGPPVGDVTGGLYAVVSILAALHAPTRPRGVFVDLALHDCLLSLLGAAGQFCLMNDRDLGPSGSQGHWSAPNGCYQASDGWIAVCADAPEQWRSFVALQPFKSLQADERFTTPQQRRMHLPALDNCLNSVFAGRPSAEWLALLSAREIPCAPVRTVAEALDSELTAARGMVLEMTHPQDGVFKVPNSPFRVGDERWVTQRPPPQLGQDTENVLRERLGATPARIEEWRKAGIIA